MLFHVAAGTGRRSVTRALVVCIPMSHRFRTAFTLFLASAVVWMTSCGTIFHPERVGQPRGGRLDLSIVLLDGLGLLLFFVPGVVAFIVDFATGAIYLPPGYGDTSDPTQWRVVHVPKDELTREKIAEVVSRETGRPVDLDSEELFVEKLRTIDEAAGKIAESADAP